MELKNKNVRSLLKGETSMDEIKQILSMSKLDSKVLNYYLKDTENSEFDTVICDGDLTLDVDFDPYNFNICNIIVKGNLNVPGLITFYNDPATMFFVTGDVNADNLVAGDTMEVCGNLNIKDVILCMEAEPLCVHGDLSASLFLPADAILTVGGKKNVQKTFSYQHRISDKTAFPYISDRELYLLLKDKAFDNPIEIQTALDFPQEEWNDNDYFDYVNFRGIVGMLIKNESIYRDK